MSSLASRSADSSRSAASIVAALRRAPLIRIGLAVACLLVGLYAFAQARDAAHVERANELALRGGLAAALDEARQVHGGPALGDALLVAAEAELALGRVPVAIADLRDAVRRDPRDWALYQDLALALWRDGRQREAVHEYEMARRLNPRMPGPGR